EYPRNRTDPRSRGTVKDDDFSLQARAEINVNVVSWTSHACSLLLTLRRPFTDTEFRASDYLGGHRVGNIISIVNNKGGFGKTTVAVNLTHTLARWGQRVLVIDRDSQCNTVRNIWRASIRRRRLKSSPILG